MSVYARERELSRAWVPSILQCIPMAVAVPPDVRSLTKPMAVVQGCGLIEAAPLTPYTNTTLSSLPQETLTRVRRAGR